MNMVSERASLYTYIYTHLGPYLFLDQDLSDEDGTHIYTHLGSYLFLDQDLSGRRGWRHGGQIVDISLVLKAVLENEETWAGGADEPGKA